MHRVALHVGRRAFWPLFPTAALYAPLVNIYKLTRVEEALTKVEAILPCGWAPKEKPRNAWWPDMVRVDISMAGTVCFPSCCLCLTSEPKISQLTIRRYTWAVGGKLNRMSLKKPGSLTSPALFTQCDHAASVLRNWNEVAPFICSRFSLVPKSMLPSFLSPQGCSSK